MAADGGPDATFLADAAVDVDDDLRVPVRRNDDRLGRRGGKAARLASDGHEFILTRQETDPERPSCPLCVVQTSCPAASRMRSVAANG